MGWRARASAAGRIRSYHALLYAVAAAKIRLVSDEPRPAFADRERLGDLVVLLLVWLGAAVVFSAVAAPAVYWLVDALAPGRFPFQRVLRRVAMLAAIVLLVLLRRRLGVARWADLGLARSRRRWRACGAAALVGGATLTVVFVVERLLGTRIAVAELSVVGAFEAIAGAAVIGLVEEALCRGALLFPFGRLKSWRFWAGNALVSGVYATAHFVRGGRSPSEVDWGTGWEIWARIGPAVAGHVEAWCGLAATGALFYALAWRQGHVWGAAGLHAGAVLALQIGGGLSDPAVGGRSFFLVDGLLPGYPLAALSTAATIWIWWGGRRQAA